MKFAAEIKFKLWGFSTSRLVLMLHAAAILYVVGVCSLRVQESPPYPNWLEMEALMLLPVNLVALALVFCFLPPFDELKLYVSWPLTALAMLFAIFLI